MTTSGEMRATTPATMQDLKDVEDRVIRRQSNYEKLCEEDRKSLRGKVENVETILQRVEAKTDAGNSMIQPIADMFKPLFAKPRIQTAMISVILAALGYFSYKLQSMSQPAVQQTTPQQIIVYPPHSVITDTDGGK